MGQCVSRKATEAVNRRKNNNNNRPMLKPNDFSIQVLDRDDKKERRSCTRGVSTSFGFKQRRPKSSIPVVSSSSSSSIDNNVRKNRPSSTPPPGTASIDRNGNDDTIELLLETSVTSGRSTPRLMPPKKKEANATRINRFGFRQSNTNRTGIITTTTATTVVESQNNNVVTKPKKSVSIATAPPKIVPFVTSTPEFSEPTRYKFHSIQLPKPQMPVRVIDTSKYAKTAANINRKVFVDEGGSSSKEGSLTEDSGVGSQTSNMAGGSGGDTDTLHGIEVMDNSPTFGVHRSMRKQLERPRVRNLDVIVSGHSFDVRDLDDSEVTDISLPRLPSAFANHRNNSSERFSSIGIVRERTLEYERQLDKNRRKISVTSSEGFASDDYEEEKSFKDRTCSEKSGQSASRLFSSTSGFKESHPKQKSIITRPSKAGNPSSSTNAPDWEQGGEAMFESSSVIDFTTNSSDISKNEQLFMKRFQQHFNSSEITGKETNLPHSVLLTIENPKSITTTTPSSSSFFSHGGDVAHKTSPINNSVLLSFDDPKFAAVASASTGMLLDDEPSPVDSLISSFTESEGHCKINNSSSNNNNIINASMSDSKDINEKSPPSPGTPTNVSLSLSEGRDFLIDDEIADQPGLIFTEPIIINSDNNTVIMHTVNDSTHMATKAPVRRMPATGLLSPAMIVRAKNPLLSRTGSVDTLSPCESIASDDFMLDFEYSQSSGLDESTTTVNDHSGLCSVDEATLRSENEDGVVSREWSLLLNSRTNKDTPTSNTNVSANINNNFVRSRSNTPDSVNLVDRTRATPLTSNPLLRNVRGSIPHNSSPVAYDSDDLLRTKQQQQQQHGAMVNDIVGIKTMLLKLKRVLQETEENNMMRTEPLNPFDTNQSIWTNGHCNGLMNNSLLLRQQSGELDCELNSYGNTTSGSTLELHELRRQIEFLRTELDDKDRTMQRLQNEITKYSLDAHLNSHYRQPCNTVCNAATQTDRVRPLSAGTALLQSAADSISNGPLVSMSENNMLVPSSRKTLPPPPLTPPLKLWRKPGEPPEPSLYYNNQVSSSLPRRTRSKSRSS